MDTYFIGFTLILNSLSSVKPADVNPPIPFSEQECSMPASISENFPQNWTETNYVNWAVQLNVSNLWTFTPANVDDCLKIANWANQNGYKIRASGFMHNWSPFTVVQGTPSCSKIVLVKTAVNLNAIEKISEDLVRVQAGASMETFLAFLEKNELGIVNHPAPGDVTVGGALAINAHGTSIPAQGEQVNKGHTYGSMSNMITQLTAIVWDSSSSSYILKTFSRSDPEIGPFMTNLGRAFITEVVLKVGPSVKLRCESIVNIPAKEIFQDPATTTQISRTFESFLQKSGRVEIILFPFTSNPWVKVWTLAPSKPLLSKAVNAPFNYVFADTIPEEISNLVGVLVSGNWSVTPLLGKLMYDTATVGLLSTITSDIWGPSKNTMLYVKPTTLRVTANGYAIHTTRAKVQFILNKMYVQFEKMLAEYAAQNLYPINGPMEIRVTGLDKVEDIGIDGAQSPTFSATSRSKDHPEFDVAIWFDILTFPVTPNHEKFLAEYENFLYINFNDQVALFRPEWSKGWAYDEGSTWNNEHVLNLARSSFGPDNWNFGVSILKDKYDPNGIFSNEYLDKLLQTIPQM